MDKGMVKGKCSKILRRMSQQVKTGRKSLQYVRCDAEKKEQRKWALLLSNACTTWQRNVVASDGGELQDQIPGPSIAPS